MREQVTFERIAVISTVAKSDEAGLLIVEVFKRLGGDNNDPYHLVSVYSITFQGDYAEAAPLYPRAAEIREKMLGPDHQDVATTLNNWALLLRDQVRAVRILWEISIEIWIASGPEHPAVVAIALNNRAVVEKCSSAFLR